MILGLRSLEQMKLDKAGYAFEIVSRVSQTFSNASSEPFLTRKRFMAMNMICLPTTVTMTISERLIMP